MHVVRPQCHGRRYSNHHESAKFHDVRVHFGQLWKLSNLPYQQLYHGWRHRDTSSKLCGKFCSSGKRVGRQPGGRSEEHTSELQSLMRISYDVFGLKNTKNTITKHTIIMI